MLKTVIMAACLCALSMSPAEARLRRHFIDVTNIAGCSDPVMQPCETGTPKRLMRKAIKRETFGQPTPFAAKSADSQIVGSRPTGCPHRYCGCALSLKLFGRIIPRLNLAANWLSFPRAVPSDGMVAARRGHVFLLKRQISGSTWWVWDPNSGHGRTRVHARSIAGFRIVDPHAHQMAALVD